MTNFRLTGAFSTGCSSITKGRTNQLRKAFRGSLSAIVFVAAVVVATPMQAQASPYGTDAGGPNYMPDSRDHWFCFDASVPTGSRFRYRDAMATYDSQTVAWDRESSYCGSKTDVRFIEAWGIPVGISGVIGWAPCITYTSVPNVCDAGQVWTDPTTIFFYNGGFSGNPTVLDTMWRHNIQHEVGHTGGMAHYNYSGPHAMYSGLGDTSAWLTYRTHDACHVNGLLLYGSWSGC